MLQVVIVGRLALFTTTQLADCKCCPWARTAQIKGEMPKLSTHLTNKTWNMMPDMNRYAVSDWDGGDCRICYNSRLVVKKTHGPCMYPISFKIPVKKLSISSTTFDCSQLSLNRKTRHVWRRPGKGSRVNGMCQYLVKVHESFITMSDKCGDTVETSLSAAWDRPRSDFISGCHGPLASQHAQYFWLLHNKISPVACALIRHKS